MYRRRSNRVTWHWCQNCSKWPTTDYEERDRKPGRGELCNQCRAKDREGECGQIRLNGGPPIAAESMGSRWDRLR
jgi:hypothetical protein